MKLYMKQKVFSWSDRFFVKDEDEKDIYAVEGEFFTWGKKLHIYDMSGKEVAFIKQKLASMSPQYIVEINGQEVCSIVKKPSLLRPSYKVNGLSWLISGNAGEHEYSITHNDRTIMNLTKHFLTWGDSYELNIADEKNALVCLCIAIAIDSVAS